MPGFKVETKASVSGPLADGAAGAVLARWQREVVKELAARALKTLKAWPLDESGRSKGGFKRNLKAMRRGNYARIPGPRVRGVTWAPWLEGTTGRNESTGFGGYHLFETTAESVENVSQQVGEEVLAKILPELGGK